MANSQDVINRFTTGKVCVLFFASLLSPCWWSFHCQIFLNMFEFFIRFSLCVFFLCLCESFFPNLNAPDLICERLFVSICIESSFLGMALGLFYFDCSRSIQGMMHGTGRWTKGMLGSRKKLQELTR
jgi:hypothetical protein